MIFISHDREDGKLYVKLGEREDGFVPFRVFEPTPGVVLHLDDAGKLLGVEIRSEEAKSSIAPVLGAKWTGPKRKPAEIACFYCKHPTRAGDFGMCGGCFYGRMMVPKQWKKEMIAKGIVYAEAKRAHDEWCKNLDENARRQCRT